MVCLYPSGKATITYAYKLVGESIDNTNFSYGLNADLLRSLESSIPTSLRPISGGYWRCYKTDGTLLFDKMGYATRHETNLSRWTLGRVYNTNAQFGPWSADNFKTGYYIEGTCFATY